ncbi:MAG: transposase family protein, partial [Actinomycetota bacterium]|nr:transposase family protein [Actinomycetota bacterium]
MSVPYRGALDVPRELVIFLSRLLAAERRRRGTRRGRRALTPFRQAVLVLRWLRDAAGIDRLAADAGISPATAYRYVHEGIDVLADAA